MTSIVTLTGSYPACSIPPTFGLQTTNMKLTTLLMVAFAAVASAQGNSTSPNATISVLEVRSDGQGEVADKQAIVGYPELSTLAGLITGPLANSSFGLVEALNSTSNTTQLTVFAPTNAAFGRITNDPAVTKLVNTLGNGTASFAEIAIANHILPNIAANSSVISQLLLQSNHTEHLLIDFDYAATRVLTLAGLNISVTGIIQNGSTLSTAIFPPLLFVQNAFIVTPDAIVAENGVVHIISNVIDPFILATGGLFGPTKEVVAGLDNTLAPLMRFLQGYLNVGNI